MTRSPAAPGAGVPPHRALMPLLAVSAFAVAGTIHYQTPSLAAISAAFDADAAAAGWVPTLSFAGLLAGNLFLVPLGDRLDKRRLILGELAVLVLALIAMAAAPSIAALAAASFVVGVCSSLPQLFVPIVTELAPPERRGRTVGTLLTALFVGILFARISGGLIAEHLGWRWNYVLSAAMVLALAPVLSARLPPMPARSRLGYGTLMWSIARLLAAHRQLQRVAAIQFLLGLCYGGFWATVAPMLAAFHHVGPLEAGLMGIPGAAGILVARPAGRWMDRSGAGPVVATGVAIVCAGWTAFSFSALSILAVVAGAMLLDCGLRTAMVANQTLVNAAVPEARSRANTIFATHVWAGNASGALLASGAFARFGWSAVCAVALSAAALALLIQLCAARGTPTAPAPRR